jgi:hypothetical protein
MSGREKPINQLNYDKVSMRIYKERNMEKRLWKPILLLGLFLFTVIACRISFDSKDEESSREDIEFQLTLVAMQRTQTVAAAPPDKPKQPPEDSLPDKDSDDDSGDDTACNSSKFVSETIPDGSVYQAGETFTKSWTIRNAGTCDWTTDYKFVFESGDQMNGLTSMNLPSVIKPGEKITFQIDLTAPSANGDYTGIWRLKAADGEKLGKYWVKITVGSGAPPPATFAVTGVEFYMPHINIDMGCSGDVTVWAEITTSAAGIVTYHWVDSAGGASVPLSVTFAGAEKKIVEYNVLIDFTDDYQVDLYIDEPNHQWFGPKEFHVNCTP